MICTKQTPFLFSLESVVNDNKQLKLMTIKTGLQIVEEQFHISFCNILINFVLSKVTAQMMQICMYHHTTFIRVSIITVPNSFDQIPD